MTDSSEKAAANETLNLKAPAERSLVKLSVADIEDMCVNWNKFVGNPKNAALMVGQLANQLADTMRSNERLRKVISDIAAHGNSEGEVASEWQANTMMQMAEEALKPYKQSLQPLPDIHKIQSDANMLLDGIVAIELYNDEIHYDGKIIYRGLYNRDDVDHIVRAYKEKQPRLRR